MNCYLKVCLNSFTLLWNFTLDPVAVATDCLTLNIAISDTETVSTGGNYPRPTNMRKLYNKCADTDMMQL